MGDGVSCHATCAKRAGDGRCLDRAKLQRGTVSYEEMVKIAETLNVGYEQVFVLPSGDKIGKIKEL